MPVTLSSHSTYINAGNLVFIGTSIVTAHHDTQLVCGTAEVLHNDAPRHGYGVNSMSFAMVMISGTEMLGVRVEAVSYPAACSWSKLIPHACRPEP